MLFRSIQNVEFKVGTKRRHGNVASCKASVSLLQVNVSDLYYDNENQRRLHLYRTTCTTVGVGVFCSSPGVNGLCFFFFLLAKIKFKDN